MSIEAPDRLNGQHATEPAWIRFRPGPGGELAPEWAAYMLNQWWAARDKKYAFAEAVKAAAMHFMVGEQEG